MPYLEAEDGTEIYFNDWGDGTPVVLIHGWPLNGDMWEKQASWLVEHGLRVITYDRRGFGKSSQPWDGYDYDTFASDLNDIMEELDLLDAVLVGFSMGGGEVVRYLSTYGQSRVAKAVLISAVTPYLLKTDDNPEGIPEKIFDDIDAQLSTDRPAFLSSFGATFYGRTAIHHTVSEEVLAWSQTLALQGSLRATRAAAKAWSTTDFRAEMESITLPVLVIHGTGDKTVPIDASGRRSVKILPNASLSEYDGEPHGLILTAADRLNEELLHFIGGETEPITDPEIA